MSVIITYVCHDYGIIELKSNSGGYCTQLSEKNLWGWGGARNDVTGAKTKLHKKKYYEIRELSRMRWT